MIFLNKCVTCVENPKHKELLLKKLPPIKKFYVHTDDYSSTEDFKKLIQEKIELLTSDKQQAVRCFNAVYLDLKAAYVNKDCDDESIPLDKKFKIIRLERVLRKISKKVKSLEVAELDMDDWDNNNSPYMKLQK